MALVFLTSDDASPLSYVEPFGEKNTYGINLSEVTSAVNGQGRYQTLSALNYACYEAEKTILSGCHFIPLWQLPTVLAANDDAAELLLDPFSKTVYFESAKMY